jgi:hypothetical protein
MTTNPAYRPTSPYALTPVSGRFLGRYVHRVIPPSADDLEMIVSQRFVGRPDLLALEVYGDEALWWVIPQRNGLEDPVGDMTLDRVLAVPSRRLVQSAIR